MLSFYKSSAEGGGFKAPSTSDFVLPPIFDSVPWFTKPVALVFLSVILISVFFIVSSRKASIVPSKLQFAGEGIYSFVRNDLARDVIGPEFIRFVPYLFTLFTFVLTNNVFAIVPMLQFPPMSRVGFPYALAILTLFTFHYVGIRRQGFGKYIKNILFMPGIPKPAYVLITPIEIVTFFVSRPLTLALRLFANMFAGHLLLLVFILGGEYMLNDSHLIMKLFSPFAFSFGIVLTFFEFLVQCLQAYIVTLLSALYIAGALVDEH